METNVTNLLFIGVVLFVFAMGFFVVHYVMGEIVTDMAGIEAINQSNATMESLNGIDNVKARLDYVVFGLFIGFILFLIISSYFASSHPIYMFIYFIVIILAVITSTFLSNLWKEVSRNAQFATTYLSFPMSDHILQNLPVYIGLFGFIGIVILFARPYYLRKRYGYE